LPTCQRFYQVFFVCIFMGIAGALALPAATAMAVEEGRKYGMGSTMGLLNLGMSAGLGAGPMVAGWVSDALGFPYAFYLATFVGLAGTIGFGSLSSRRGSP
jgi:DHA1 family multidrug resistance protein-like MFS transporter